MRKHLFLKLHGEERIMKQTTPAISFRPRVKTLENKVKHKHKQIKLRRNKE